VRRTGRRGKPLVWLLPPAALVGAVALVAYLGFGYHPVSTTNAFALGPATLELVPVEPAPGSGNKHVWLMSRATAGSAVIRFELRNDAPFPVTVETERDGPRWGRELVVEESGRWTLVDRVRVSAGSVREVGLRFVVDEGECGRGMWGSTAWSESARLRVRYLGVYRRTDTVELPFAWAMACERELPPAYDGDW